MKPAYQPIAYIAAILAAAVVLAFGIGRLTAPDAKIQARGQKPEAVRQIPITRATAQNNGDPDNKLSPVYPANPGKDLPVKDAAVKLPEKAVAGKAETTGLAASASSATPVTARANACDVSACASAYRSFRESDCSYQPYGGLRKICDMNGGEGDDARTASRAVPQTSGQAPKPDDNNDELSDVVRAVKRMPMPDESRYSLRYNWIDER